mgnify:CR=1 FL=1
MLNNYEKLADIGKGKQEASHSTKSQESFESAFLRQLSTQTDIQILAV